MSRPRGGRSPRRSIDRQRADESSVDRLLRDLEHGGTAVEVAPDAVPGVYSMTAYRGDVLNPPARFTVLGADLDALLESTRRDDDPQFLWPDRDPWTTAYFLFLANLDEEVARYDHKIGALTVGPTGVRGTPRDDWDPSPLRPGFTVSNLGDPHDHRWTATRPGD